MTHVEERKVVPSPPIWVDWPYPLSWFLICLVVGYGTFMVIADAPAIAPVDRQQVDEGAPTIPQTVRAKAVRIQSLDEATQEVAWELRVPKTTGGVATATTFDNPELILFPEGDTFTITAGAGSIEAAPAGEMHGPGNIALELTGPITGTNPPGSETFSAASALWDGPQRTLTLVGAPLQLTRQDLRVEADTLVVTFLEDGGRKYDLKGNVKVVGQPR